MHPPTPWCFAGSPTDGDIFAQLFGPHGSCILPPVVDIFPEGRNIIRHTALVLISNADA